MTDGSRGIQVVHRVVSIPRDSVQLGATPPKVANER